MKSKIVTIQIEVDTDKDDLIIRSAAMRGIMYGMDVKRVASPQRVKINNITIEDKTDNK